jgi:hypothetical protein
MAPEQIAQAVIAAPTYGRSVVVHDAERPTGTEGEDISTTLAAVLMKAGVGGAARGHAACAQQSDPPMP